VVIGGACCLTPGALHGSSPPRPSSRSPRESFLL
jgi:hypothetical protein